MASGDKNRPDCRDGEQGWFVAGGFVLRVVMMAVAMGLMLIRPVWADPLRSLTLQEAMRLADENNPQLKAAKAELDIAQASILSAGARLNPALMSDNGVAEKTYRLGIEQTVELGGKRQKRVAVAQTQHAVVLSEISIRRLALRAEVRGAYTGLFNCLERERATRDMLQTTERLLEVTPTREQAGEVALLDVLQAEIAMVNARNEMQTLAYQVIEARNRLNALMNLPLPTTLQLAPPGDFLEGPASGALVGEGHGTFQAAVSQVELDLEALIQLALARRPEFLQNRLSREVIRRQLTQVKANRIPNLRVTGGYDRVTGEASDHGIFVMGSLELPVFNRQQGPIAEARARISQIEREQQALTQLVTLQVSNAVNAVNASRQRVQQYETQLLPRAQTVVDKSRRSFEAGKSAILMPLSAQQAYINTRLGHLQAVLDSQNAISDLERAIGTDL